MIPGEYPGDKVPPALVKLAAAIIPVPFRVPPVLLLNVPVLADTRLIPGTDKPAVMLPWLVKVPASVKIPLLVKRSMFICPPVLLKVALF